MIFIYDDAIDWMILRGDWYEPLAIQEGIYRSEVFPGLWLDPIAMLNGDVASVLAILQKGLATVEHKDFLSRLQKPKG